MKKTKSKKYLIISICVIVFLICYISFFDNSDNERLSEEQIIALREVYPVCGVEEPVGIVIRKVALEEVKAFAQTFVYGKVIGEPSTYEVSASTGNTDIDDKRDESGIGEIYEFYEYKIEVIDDSEAMYSKGDVITIASNVALKEYNPQLSDGMKMVVPVVADEEKEGRTYYMLYGMYYVTQDDYVISAFDETVTKSTLVLSGLKVNALLDELKK